MKSKKDLSRANATPSSSNSSRRTFLKQSFAFAALTSTYSVVSLSQLACNDANTTLNGGYYNGNYFEGDYMGSYIDNDYIDDYFNNFFYY
jgi:hypothetical protein